MKNKILSLLTTLLFLPLIARADDYFLVGMAGVDLSLTPTTPLAEMGIPYPGKQGFFEYAKANGVVTAGNFVVIDDVNDATEMTTTLTGAAPKKIGCAVATAADNDYMWIWRGGGTFECIVANAVAADTQLTTTATAGDAGTGGDAIAGCRTVDLGVTDTRVTVQCGGLAYAGS